jgi:putative aldouronate transport system permease protein
MRANIIGKLKYFRYLYLMLFGAILYYILFNYMPMYGATLAFREFQYNSTIFQAPWVGFKYFKQLFSLADYWNAFKNTILISFGRLLVEFPVPIILAVLLNEIRGSKLKRFYQTIYTFPHFLSWVLIVGILNTMLLSDGLINSIIISFNGKPIGFLTTPSLFRPILYATSLWKEIGWNSIIYLAALTSIDPELYQAAKVDGANRFQQMTYITLPGIMDTILVMLLIFIGNFLRHGNFDQVFNMYNSTVYSVGDIVDACNRIIDFQVSERGLAECQPPDR